MDCHLTHGVLSRPGLLSGQDGSTRRSPVSELSLGYSEDRLSEDLNVSLQEGHQVSQPHSAVSGRDVEGSLTPSTYEVVWQLVDYGPYLHRVIHLGEFHMFVYQITHPSQVEHKGP